MLFIIKARQEGEVWVLYKWACCLDYANLSTKLQAEMDQKSPLALTRPPACVPPHASCTAE